MTSPEQGVGTTKTGGFGEWTGTACVKTSPTTTVCTATMSITPAWIPGCSDADSDGAAGERQVDATVKANVG